jgi:hypothetical protein
MVEQKTTKEIIEGIPKEICEMVEYSKVVWFRQDELIKFIRHTILEANEKFADNWSEEYFKGYQNALGELEDKLKLVVPLSPDDKKEKMK